MRVWNSGAGGSTRVLTEGVGSERSGRRGIVVALIGVVLLSIPVVSLGTTATARGPLPGAATRTCANGTYTVLSGDSWARISTRLKVTMSALLVANGATTGIVIHPGDVLCVPAGASPVSTLPATALPVTALPVTALPATGLPATTTPVTTGATTPAASGTQPSGSAAAPLAANVIRQFPVQGVCWFTDSYGAPRSGGRSHEGVDIIAKTGQLVYAADDGTLTKQYIDTPGAMPGNGWRITRADGTYFFYGHLSSFAAGLKVGSAVKSGQIIGRVGMTGNAGTPHLHFEVHPYGAASINPTPVVNAVNGCKITAVPAQPGTAPAPILPASGTTTSPTTTPTTTSPTTTALPTTSTTTALPTTTVPGPVAPPAAPLATTGGLWQFVNPVLAFDSAKAGRLVAGRQVSITVNRLANVAPTTTGVLVRVAAKNVTAGGHLALRACNATTSTTTLTFAPGQPNIVTTVVPVSVGSFCVVASTGVDLRVAVIAYQSPIGVGMQPVAAKRVLDTRPATVAAGTGRAISLASLGVPAGTKAVTVAITVLGATRDGTIGVGACGGTPWIVSFRAQPMVVMSGVMQINGAGLCVLPSVTVNVVVDVTGVWVGSTALTASAPIRLFDSRTSSAGITPTVTTIALSVPAGALRAQLTITLVGGASSGTLRVWNCADAPPAAVVAPIGAGAVLSVTVGMNVANGSFCMSSNGGVHAIVDLTAVG